jgi:hypothetical protein
VKAFIIKVIMLGEKRISNISNITALVKETGVSRRALNHSGRLRFQGYLLDSAIGEGIQILDVSSIMLDSEENFLEHRNFVQVNIFENFASLRKRS